mgnify:CR=1 FL=1
MKTNLAISLLNRQHGGDEEEALSLLREVLKKDPENLRAKYCSALLLLHRGQLEDALDAFLTVIKKVPANPEALYFTGKTLMQLSRYEEALQYFSDTNYINQILFSCN